MQKAICTFEAILVYKASSRAARVTPLRHCVRVSTPLEGDPSHPNLQNALCPEASFGEDPGHSLLGCLSSLLPSGKDSSVSPAPPSLENHLITGSCAAAGKGGAIKE